MLTVDGCRFGKECLVKMRVVVLWKKNFSNRQPSTVNILSLDRHESDDKSHGTHGRIVNIKVINESSND